MILVVKYKQPYRLTNKQKELARVNQPLVFWYIKRLLQRSSTGLDAEDVNEITSECLLKLCHIVYKFDPTRGLKFSTYAVRGFRSVVWEYYNHIKPRAKKLPHLPNEEWIPDPHYPDSIPNDPEALRLLINRAQLTPKQHRVITLFLKYGDLPTITKKLKCTRQNIYTHFHNSIKKIRDTVQCRQLSEGDF